MSEFIKARRGANNRGLHDFCKYIGQYYNTEKLNILEIGAYLGESANIFAKYFKSVTSIDSWEKDKCLDASYNMKEVEAIFDEIAKINGNIQKIKGRSEDVYHLIKDKSFDIVYIDGDHSGEAVKNDIKNYLPKAKLFIAGHDYGSDKNEYLDLIDTVDRELGKPDRIFDDYSWIKRL